MRRVVYIFTILGALASCVGGAAGGGILENQAGRHASVDHDCPTKQVSVISSKGPIASRVVVLNVCGQRRTYRDVGGTTNILWQEVTASGITPGAKRITAIEAGSVLRAAKTEVIRCVESEETPPSAIKLRAQVNGDGSALYVGAVPAPSADATTCLDILDDHIFQNRGFTHASFTNKIHMATSIVNFNSKFCFRITKIGFSKKSSFLVHNLLSR